MKRKISIRICHILLSTILIALFNSCTKDVTHLPPPLPFDSPNCPEYYMAIAAGGQHSLALEPDGILWAWSRNNVGQLGCGSIPYFRNTPMHIGPG